MARKRKSRAPRRRPARKPARKGKRTVTRTTIVRTVQSNPRRSRYWRCRPCRVLNSGRASCWRCRCPRKKCGEDVARVQVDRMLGS